MSTTHPNPKVAAAQQRILDADDQINAINLKRLELLADEEAAAKKAKKKAEQEAQREAALEILLPIKFDISVGKTVCGIRQERWHTFLVSQFSMRHEPECRFTVTSVHIGRKHLGVHVQYEGSKGQHWVAAPKLTQDNHALDNGSSYCHAETKPYRLRQTGE